MSVESARGFLSKVAKNDEFRKELGRCKTRTEQQQFAKGAGFEFTGDEMRAAAGELQDADLETISGGSCCGCTCESEMCPGCSEMK
jgi:predicted ribosomally synthesized peptide with nif11-like leader